MRIIWCAGIWRTSMEAKGTSDMLLVWCNSAGPSDLSHKFIEFCSGPYHLALPNHSAIATFAPVATINSSTTVTSVTTPTSVASVPTVSTVFMVTINFLLLRLNY